MTKGLLISFLITVSINVVSHAQDLTILKKIALLPADVRITGNTTQIKPEEIYQAELTTGFKFQSKMYEWFLKSKKKVKNSFEVQDIKTTNQMLFSGGMSLNQYRSLPKDSIAKMLEVDVVLFCNSTIERSVKGIDPLPMVDFMLMPNLLSAITSLPISSKEAHKLFITVGFNENKASIPSWSQKYGHYNNGIYKMNDIFKRIIKDLLDHFPKSKN